MVIVGFRSKALCMIFVKPVTALIANPFILISQPFGLSDRLSCHCQKHVKQISWHGRRQPFTQPVTLKHLRYICKTNLA